jgi:hypothetical protein
MGAVTSRTFRRSFFSPVSKRRATIWPLAYRLHVEQNNPDRTTSGQTELAFELKAP